MTYQVVPTVATGDIWSAANHNTYLRDNLAALWPYTTAGDVVYASSASALARLAAGAENQVLKVASGLPVWGNVPGLIDIQIAKSTAEKQYTTSTWEDHPGLSITLTLPRTSTILMLSTVTGYVTTAAVGYKMSIRGVIDGTADSGLDFNGSANPARNEALPYVWFRKGILSGSRVIKIQCKEGQSGVDTYITTGRLVVLVFGE